MNRLIRFSAAFAASAILFTTSCKKDKDDNNNNTTPPSKLNQLFSELKTAPQTFTVNSGDLQTIEGANGLKITFYPESFLDQNNNIIPINRQVEIKLIETLTYNDMFLNRVQTATQNNQRLISGGAYHLEATMNGTPLKANKYGVSFPAGNTEPTTPMAIYTGYTQDDLGGPTVMWYDDTTGTTNAKRQQDAGGGSAFAYIFDSVSSFGWINCDYFYNDTRPRTDIGVTFPNSNYNDDNTEVYVVFPEINSITKMYNYLPNSNSFTFHISNYYIPVGAVIDVVTVTERDENYYLGIQNDVTVVNNLTVNVNPESVNLTAIINAIANL